MTLEFDAGWRMNYGRNRSVDGLNPGVKVVQVQVTVLDFNQGLILHRVAFADVQTIVANL